MNEKSAPSEGEKKFLFWACFISLITTAFGFIIRAIIIDEWGTVFNLTETQKGEIFGVGLWPFAISIILFSLVIDRIGYKTAMYFAFACHALSVIMTIVLPMYFDPYWSLYFGTFIVALGNGTVEAVVNPVVATLFPNEKTKWLNALHAGWPGGLVLGGIITIGMGPGGFLSNIFSGGESMAWQYKVALILIPTVIYGLMMLPCRFPVNERVAAGVSYGEMLAEFGMGGAFIVGFLMFNELGRVATELLGKGGVDASGWMIYAVWGCIALGTIGMGAITKFAIGRPLFLFMLLIMVPLATTELGTDSWITSLMEPVMTQNKLAAGWIIVYTSLIMMILRFFAGPIVHKLSPLGLLAASSVIAIVGLVFLSKVESIALIFIAATIYGLGKTFFWPTMLGVVAEQSPRGGALTLNATGGVGMLGVGVVGAVFLGYFQDSAQVAALQDHPAILKQVEEEKNWVFGTYNAVNVDAVKKLPEAEQEIVTSASETAKKDALFAVAVFPCIMLACYLLLIVYFASQGGYKAEVLVGHGAEDEKFTGGLEGPADA
ncbi:MFS transporter [Blastopirellula sp. JC732]|uniref:MFS transporter n=1 Tax=Blastopirellula sediminis TaxID=2894196 RepID=A0A9X1SMP6_9BACT|nr:MFS transporter [Blastopirellula sediminis]MCC9604797.1 MFS transporter [Blastopirellula sediminis]MCC9631904.1 MFS transporter [Blastopirellula sediminis]